MSGMERRRQLLAWLNEAGILSLPEMVERFGVSKMTVHRDLEALEQRRVLKRIHGGAVALDRGETPVANASRGEGSCRICQRPVGSQLLYGLTLAGGVQQPFCCAHCGVSAQLGAPEQVVMAMATDFLTGRPHAAQHSWFVLGSVVVPCCHPSMLTFADEAMARRFQTGFGGQVGRMADALDFLRGEMGVHRKGESCPHCAPALGVSSGGQ